MPKIVSEEEREQVREAIYQKTIILIRQNGIRGITVDDIAHAVGISKGAFYQYYPSKEAGIYEVIKRSESELFGCMEETMSHMPVEKNYIRKFFHEIFLAPESIVLYLSPLDLEVLLRKLPQEYRDREDKKLTDYFQRCLNLLNLNENQMEVVTLLTDCLGVIATNGAFGEKSTQKALDVLVDAISDYLVGEKGDSH